MIIARRREGIVVSRASAKGGWESDPRHQPRPARSRRAGRNPSSRAQHGAEISAGRWATLGEGGRFPDLTAFPACDWPTMFPATLPEVVPVAVTVPGPRPDCGDAGPVAAPVETGASVRIDCREDLGIVEVHDPRLFRAGREAFCRALVEEAVGPGRALRAEVCLTSSDFRLEFEPGRFNRAGLAERVVSAVRVATPAASGPIISHDDHRDAWTSLTAFAADGGPSLWETRIEHPGRVVLRHRALLDAPWLAVRVARALRDLRGMRACRAFPWSGHVVIDVDPGSGAPDGLVEAAEAAYRRESRAARPVAGVPVPGPIASEEAPPVETGPQRVLGVALAGGSFALAIAGFVLPGIPSAPFLLLSHHYLLHAMPATYRWLSRQPGVGTLIRKADRAGRPWEDRRAMWKTLGWSALAAAAFLVIHPPLPVALALEFGLFAFSGPRG